MLSVDPAVCGSCQSSRHACAASRPRARPRLPPRRARTDPFRRAALSSIMTPMPTPPTATPRAAETLYRANVPRFLAVLAAQTLVAAVLCAVGIVMAFGGPLDVSGAFATFCVSCFGFLPFLLLALFFKVDARGPNYLKLPHFRVEVFDRHVVLRDAAGAVVGDTAAGTLQVTRANLQLGKMICAATRLDGAHGQLYLAPLQTVGAWPGVVAASNIQPKIVENHLHDELTRLAT